MLYQITSKWFVAAVVLREDRVVIAPPILKYMRGWSLERVRNYCKKRTFKIVRVKGNR